MQPEDPATIDAPYLLALNIPCYASADGRRVVDRLWQKDLEEHLHYIRRLTLAAPLSSGPPPAGAVELPSVREEAALNCIDLGAPRSLPSALLGMPADAVRLWRAIGRAEVVHTGVAGWPIPIGWVAAPIARLRRRLLVIIVESAPWRLHSEARAAAGPASHLRAAAWERMARWCIRLADVAIFTHTQYRDSLLGEGRPGYVIPASWIDERAILTDGQAEAVWSERFTPANAPLALAYAGRLTAAKGIPTLLDAMRLLDGRNIRVTLDIFGEGELRDDCARVAAQLEGPARIHMRGTLPYDDSFFRALRSYQAAVIPSLGDEQPRIAFDAMSQALPILGSDTPGLRQCVIPGGSGLLMPPGDPEALAAAISRVADRLDELRRMGLAGLTAARALTHREMHRRRLRILLEALSARRVPPLARRGSR